MPEREIDVSVSRDGSIFLFTFHTERAKEWQEQYVEAEGYQWLGENLAVEYSFARLLVDGMQRDGLVVE